MSIIKSFWEKRLLDFKKSQKLRCDDVCLKPRQILDKVRGIYWELQVFFFLNLETKDTLLFTSLHGEVFLVRNDWDNNLWIPVYNGLSMSNFCGK
jgi:hypothetical protein